MQKGREYARAAEPGANNNPWIQKKSMLTSLMREKKSKFDHFKLQLLSRNNRTREITMFSIYYLQILL